MLRTGSLLPNGPFITAKLEIPSLCMEATEPSGPSRSLDPPAKHDADQAIDWGLVPWMEWDWIWGGVSFFSLSFFFLLSWGVCIIYFSFCLLRLWLPLVFLPSPPLCLFPIPFFFVLKGEKYNKISEKINSPTVDMVPCQCRVSRNQTLDFGSGSGSSSGSGSDSDSGSLILQST